MRYGSVCSGVEAASLAWEPLGWQPAWFAEIEPFPAAVLAYHWPQVPNRGDMTNFMEWDDEPINLLVGGTPCQSFSVAGLRRGLDDPRGNLMLAYLAIARRYRPEWLVWENVPGVLSSNDGRDFGTFLGGLAELGYGFAFRVLDAQYFGVPQRRRRVFVVGHLGDWRRAAAVLFERASLQGDIAPRRATGQDLAAPTARGVDTCGADDNQAQAGYLIAYGGGNSAAIDTATTLTAHGQRLDFDSETFVVNGRQDPVVSGIAQALGCQNNGMDNVLCIKGTAIDRAPQHGGNGLGIAEDGVCPTLTAADRHAVQYADAVRRLTPAECERLQGMPDNHTRIPWRGKNAADCPDGPRYKAIGNSMAVPVMRWIGERIALQSSLAASSLAVGL